MSKERLYDVLAINLTTKKVRILKEDINKENAEAIVKFAVIRRGKTEFYCEANAGAYRDGDKWEGKDK